MEGRGVMLHKSYDKISTIAKVASASEMPKEDVYISVDIEADGPIPGDYSMSSLGAAVVDEPEHTFYLELKPISERWDPQAAAVAGLEREALMVRGTDAEAGMRAFATWIREVARGRRPVFVGFNATFDWSFVHWYFMHFTGEDPFGISGLDIKAYYMGALGKRRWADTTKGHIEPAFHSEIPHTHNALDDARGQAEMFAKIRAHSQKAGR
jgi:ribonuclease T